MAKASDQHKTEALMDSWASTRVYVFLQTTAMVVVGTILFAVAGYLLDLWLGTSPAFFIVGVFTAFPAVQVALYRKFKSYGKTKIDNLND